ncbi:MAG: Na/Pi symporter [Cyanobacteria bacterium SBLK]|nr:Na/Pi symporter [Cyanobacteria bacterium SBLK]
MSDTVNKTEETIASSTRVYYWLGAIALIYLLLVAVGAIGSGFRAIAGDGAIELFAFATNPFAGLIVGTLATAFIQSSSTITSIIVGLVAGGLPVSVAIPMVMGANIGTTITNTLVSLGYVREKEEFQRAFAAATIHDFFNFIAVVLFLPLEIFTHFFEKLARILAGLLVGEVVVDAEKFNWVGAIASPVEAILEAIANRFPFPLNGTILIILGMGAIFAAIFFLGQLLKELLVGKAKDMLEGAIGSGALKGIFSGTLVTVFVQSSSTATSLIVPLAGTGFLSLEQVYPFTLGANIGTCITAAIAATAVTTNQLPALEIAFVHLLYNAIGVIVIYGIPFLRNLPILGAKMLAKVACEQKFWAFIYIVSAFFLLPGLCLGVTLWLGY